MQMRRPIGIDLFAGAGGMSLGFEQAGFDVVAAVELDPVHAAVHHFNFPRCATICSDIGRLSGREIRRIAGIGARPVDVVFGGAPCQGFSMIGQRALEDPRNALVREFVRLVIELRPAFFVFENVKGLTVGRQRKFLEELVDRFHVHGYEVRLPWRVLNAAHFGVPQNRQRLILVGAKRGIPLPEYPWPLTRAASDFSGQLSLPPGPTCQDALRDLPNADRFDVLFEHDSVKTMFANPSRYGAELRCLNANAWHFGYRRKWHREVLTSSMRARHTQISRRRFAATAAGAVEPISRFYRLSADGISNTLRAGTDAARGAFTSPRPIHYAYPRCITVREMARLHGFPDWFRFHATKWHGARQVGNAVPPPLARAIAQSVLKTSGVKAIRPSKTISLGDPRLLGLNMIEAAAYWGVDVPIAGRNRRGTYRKRKQSEIEDLVAAE